MTAVTYDTIIMTDSACEDSMEFIEIEKALGGKNVLKNSISNRLDLIDLSNRGISKKSLNYLAHFLKLTINTKEA